MSDDPFARQLEAELDIWPADRPFPFSAAEALALCRGHGIEWRGSLDDLQRLPGRYELLSGYLILKR